MVGIRFGGSRDEILTLLQRLGVITPPYVYGYSYIQKNHIYAYNYISVNFLRTGKMVKMWHFFIGSAVTKQFDFWEIIAIIADVINFKQP